MKQINLLLLLFSVAFLSACTGGGGDDVDPDPPPAAPTPDEPVLELTQAMLTTNPWFYISYGDTHAETECNAKVEFNSDWSLEFSFIEDGEGSVQYHDAPYEIDQGSVLKTSAEDEEFRLIQKEETWMKFRLSRVGEEDERARFFMIRDEALEFGNERGVDCNPFFPG